MELTEKNGHASIEEILASVRRIIAEEPGQSAPVIELGRPMQYPRGDGLLDDPSDFDLPSMFKTQSAVPSNDKPGPLFGRLSDAIRAASTNGQNGDRSEHGLSSLKLHRAEAPDSNNASHFLLSTFHEATSPRFDELAASAPSDATTPIPAPVLATPTEADMMHPNGAAPYATPVPVQAAPQVPRQMAAFKDTRFRGMGASPGATAPMQPEVSPFEAAATAALVQAAASTSATGSVDASSHETAPLPLLMAEVPAEADDFLAVEAPASLAAAIVASYPSLAADPSPADVIPAAPVTMPVTVAPPIEHLPPPVPVQNPAEPMASAGPAPIEDSTADLLRPMLRQWLAENMPRMVEKALHIEVAESGKATKK